MDPALRKYVDGGPQLSKRTPDIYTTHNSADSLDRLFQAHGLEKWGLVIYRCTYQSNADWDTFMTRFYDSMKETLGDCNGLDLMDSFASTVTEDASFTGATTSVLREHFKQWVPDAFQRENPHLPIDVLPALGSGRYRFFMMVDQESLDSVRSVLTERGYVRLVNASWELEWDDEDLESEEHPEPLEGSTLDYVGWMNVFYDQVELGAFLDLKYDMNWIDYYERPPAIQDFL